MDAHVNFGYSTVATAPSPATSGVSLVVAAGQGARFPAAPFNATVWPTGQQPTSANAEIVRVTAVSTDTLTITRTQESTSARTIVVGDQISAGITKKMITDIETDLSSALSQVALQSAQIETRRLADLGQYVCIGLALSANASALTSVSTTIASSLFNKTAHGLVANDTITFSGIATTTGVTNGTVYYVSATGLTANAFRVATTSGGTAITLGGTTDAAITVTQVGKLNMAIGVAFMATIDLALAAQTAISTTIASMADATYPKWVVVELDSGSTVQFNQGTAAQTPVFPTITAARTPLGFLYIPAGATSVDALLTTTNGNAKLIDARVVRPGESPAGWQYDSNPWVFSTANVFTIAGVDARPYLKKGDRISYNDGAVDYGIITSVTFSTDTTVVLAANDDYAIANATLTARKYSYADSPQGWPSRFNFTPTFTGYSAAPTSLAYQYSVNQGMCTIHCRDGANGTSSTTTVTMSVPIAAATITNGVWYGACRYTNNGTASLTPGVLQMLSADNKISAFIDWAVTNGWTNSGGKRVTGGSITYPI